MTAGAINDPDLVQAIDELNYVVRRLEQLDQQLIELDEIEGYRRIVAMKSERADLLETIRVRAEKLAVAPRALIMLIGTANRLRSPRKHQLPTLSVVRSHIDIIRSAAERDHVEAEAEAKIALAVAHAARVRAKAAADGITYLDASRS